MKSTISIILLFFALPFVIYGGKFSEDYRKEVDKINALAEKGTEINKKLILKKDGFLGEGGFGFVYEGTIKKNNRSVAIKFVRDRKIKHCYEELAIYCYLKACKNPSVEKYGIPVIYYYDRWEDYILMAFTKFDMNLLDVVQNVSSFKKDQKLSNPLDILILLRDFVFQSKYMHSHGVRHDDIKPENIMIRGHRSFLIDFNLSSKLTEDRRGSSRDYRCKRYVTREKRRAIDDYESFLYTISFVTGKNWFKPEYDNKSLKDQLNVNDEVEKVIKAFADEVFTDKTSKYFPNYNNLEKIISDEIKKKHPNGEPKFSWLAIGAETSPPRNIKDISEPRLIDFCKYAYPRVQMPSKMKSPSKISFGCFSTKCSE